MKTKSRKIYLHIMAVLMLMLTFWTGFEVYLDGGETVTKLYGSVLIICMLIVTCFIEYIAERGVENDMDIE